MNNYYELGNLLGRNKIMNIVIGQRGCGKHSRQRSGPLKNLSKQVKNLYGLEDIRQN